ncbi:60S ribosomal L13 [Pyrrhoderma noxium]|uniref:60S ribosomal protein L13 n=1 Tax=Pyrrhoderma noxium TaxID=2282107 RepID=A0A286UQR7_9AGAM|nr:60S ribosomal L13 [Pyrrhoderma noxium]
MACIIVECTENVARKRGVNKKENRKMGFAHNNVLHDNHFRKDWQRRVRTWFDQPGRKLRRRDARKAKAAALGVRPLEPLRPAVRAQTVRYNTKIREGRGFTLAELKEAGIGKKEARGVGIVVDHRRRNLSEEGKALNVERLKAYKAKLIVFPRKAGKPKKGDSTGDDLIAATTRIALPLPSGAAHEAPRQITAEEREFEAYRTLREYRSEARYEGRRKVRKAKKDEEEANKKK